MAINFRGRSNAKYFTQTQVLRFYKDTPKVSSLPLLKRTTKLTRRRTYQYCGLTQKISKTQNVSKPYI